MTVALLAKVTLAKVFRGALNKLSGSNSTEIAEAVQQLPFEGEETEVCGRILAAKAASELQYQALHAKILKACKTLIPPVCAFISLAIKRLTYGDSSDGVAAGCVHFACVLRDEGLISSAQFKSFLVPLLNSSGEEVVQCICQVQEFSKIVPPEFFEELRRHAKRIAAECQGMRLHWRVEETGFGEESHQAVTYVDYGRQRAANSCTVYLSNIDCSSTEWELALVIRSLGDVNKVRLCGNPNQATQYAFVEFSDEWGAKRALERDGKCLLGKFALRWSTSRSIIQDSSPEDAVFGKNGKEKACTFGLNSDASPRTTALRASVCQQQR